MSDWRKDGDFAEQATGLFDTIAGDDFEGWADYWPDQAKFEARLFDLLEEWARHVEEQVEPTDG